MSDYTFSTLAPNDFESLCKDVLEVHLQVPLQAFTSGRDGGTDLRHAPAAGRDWIVQCKHYAGSNFSKLKASVAKEVTKLNRLKPSRYILTTSLGLTPDNVDVLFDLLFPYCTAKQDIIGKDDLNGLLRKNSDIERRHPKLWITSEAVLARILHNDVFVQSEMTREAILRRLSLFVYTASFEAARQKIAKDRVCILSGAPGVGKTTLAEMLLVEHLMDDWELVTIHQNVSEGLQIFRADSKAKQIFYYDDFLGQISSGEKLGKNEDSILLQLFNAVQRSGNRRFILTTREYILTQAKRQHEKLDRADLDVFRFVVECRDYDEEAKARILANHLYFNEVPQEHISVVVANKGYHRIIGHENYNPRLVESMTCRAETICEPDKYLGRFVARLDNPSQLWEHVFKEQISEASRQLLLVMVVCGSPVLATQLERDYEAFFSYRCKRFGWTRRTDDFRRSLNELEGTFLRIRLRHDGRVVEWHNPSVLDFLSELLKHESRDVEDLLQTATTFGHIRQLATTAQVLLPSFGTTAVAQIDEIVLREALERTMTDGANWRQLELGVRLGEVFCGGKVRALIETFLSESFDDLKRQCANPAEVIVVYESAATQNWLTPRLLDNWKEQISRYILSSGVGCVDILEELVDLSKWVAESRNIFSEVEFHEFVNTAAKKVADEIDGISYSDSQSFWTDARDHVEQLQETLSCDFSKELKTIEYGIANSDKPDQQVQTLNENISKPQSSSIDSIFDALLT